MRARTRSRLGLPLLALLLATPAAAELVAERITRENAERLLFGGTDADGGIGDWYLSNGIVEAIIDDVAPQPDLPPGVEAPPRQSEANVTGGSLIDLALVGHHNDQLNQLFAVAGLSSSNFIAYDSIEAEVAGGAAVIRVRGGALGFAPPPDQLPVTTEYVLREGDSFLTLRSRIRNDGSVSASLLSGFLDVFPWTTRALLPFSPLPDRGFNHQALDVSNPLGSLEQPPFTVAPGNVGPADGVVDPETGRTSGEVSYGLLGIEAVFDVDGPGPAPPFSVPTNLLFGASSVQATALGNAPVFLEAFPGTQVDYERRLYVGDRNDVASTANPILRELGARLGFATGTLAGRADAPVSGVATRTGGPSIPELPVGSPVTQFRSDAEGRFSGIVLPEGTYDLELRAPERDPVVVPVTVAPDARTVVSVPPLSGVARLEFAVLGDASAAASGKSETKARKKGKKKSKKKALRGRSAKKKGKSARRDRRSPIPAKITLLGLDGTPDPRLAFDVEALELSAAGDVDLRPETFLSTLAQANVVYLPRGRGSVEVRPGRYEVFASRGPEYGIDREVVEVGPGETRRLRFALDRLLPTPDALSADFHIHSARSLDSSAVPESRVVVFAAEGVEVMVATEHDFVLDYGPVIDALDMGRFVTAKAGTEITTSVGNPPVFPDAIGHMNAWPLPVRPLERRDGSVEDEFVAPNFLFSRLRNAGAAVIQYNHLRSGVRGLGGIGFFNNIGCGRCVNAVDQLCSDDDECPAAPDPQLCGCVGYQPDRPLSAAPNDILLDDDVTGSSGVPNPDGFRNIDFDVIEVANGFNFENFLQVRRDWFSLLNQAYARTPSGRIPFIPGTGVSDSHRNTLESAGYFRTWVLGTGDDPQRIRPRRFDRRVKKGRMLASTGPWIEFSVHDRRGRSAGIGRTLRPRGNEVFLKIEVLAAPWIPVKEVRVIANGAEVFHFDAGTTPAVGPGAAVPWEGGPADVPRFGARLPLELDRDTWLLVEAGESLDAPPPPDPFASRIVPGLVPHAFTNPVFVDLDGDGFDPPGVP